MRGDSSMPRSSAPPLTAAMPARAAPRPSSGRTLAGSPGTSKRRRQRTSAASRSSEIVASSKSRPFARCAAAEATTTTTASCQARSRRLRERAREPDQADPEGDREHPRGLRPPRRQHALNEVDAVRHLRRQRRDDPDHADDRGAPGEEPLRTGQAEHHVARVQQVHEGIARAPRRPDPAAALGDPAARSGRSRIGALDALPDVLAPLAARHVSLRPRLGRLRHRAHRVVRRHRLGGVPRLPVARPTRRRHRRRCSSATRGSTS